MPPILLDEINKEKESCKIEHTKLASSKLIFQYSNLIALCVLGSDYNLCNKVFNYLKLIETYFMAHTLASSPERIKSDCFSLAQIPFQFSSFSPSPLGLSRKQAQTPVPFKAAQT